MNKQNHIRQDVIWNAAGSLIYALASMVLAFSVIRLAGPRDGGIFGFGFSTLGQQMFIIAYFGIRPFHITDMKTEYSFGDYLLARRCTSLLAVAASLAFVLIMHQIGQYESDKAWVLFLLCVYKIIDGYADVYESELQRQDLLYRTGQSLAFRTTASVAALLITLAFTHNLLTAVLVTDGMQLLGTWLFAVRILKETDADYTVHSGAWRKLIQNTSLLFLSVFLDFYVFSASKYAVDGTLGSEFSGFFNILFMPTSFIYLIANFLIRPLLTRLALEYQKPDTDDFHKTCRSMLLSVLGLSAGISLLAALFGRFGLMIFELLLGPKYRGRLIFQYAPFLLLILGGGFYALANVQYYILVTMRQQKLIFLGYLAAAVVAFLTAGGIVREYGLFGAAVSYLLLMLLLFLLFTFAVLYASGKAKKDEC